MKHGILLDIFHILTWVFAVCCACISCVVIEDGCSITPNASCAPRWEASIIFQESSAVRGCYLTYYNFPVIYLTSNFLFLRADDYLKIFKDKNINFHPSNYTIYFNSLGRIQVQRSFFRQHPNFTSTPSSSKDRAKYFALLSFETPSCVYQKMNRRSLEALNFTLLPDSDTPVEKVYVMEQSRETMGSFKLTETEARSPKECTSVFDSSLESVVDIFSVASSWCIMLPNSLNLQLPEITVLKKIEDRFYMHGVLKNRYPHKVGKTNVWSYDTLEKEDYDWIEKNEKCSQSNEFTCNDGKCIGLLNVCDRKDDCSDGSDENDDYCSSLCPKGEVPCGIGPCLTENGDIDPCIVTSDPKQTWPLIATSSGFVVIASVILAVYWKHMQKLKEEIRGLTPKEVEDFLDGIQLYELPLEGRDYARRAHDLLQSMPWSRENEIPRNLIKIEYEITRGHFGIVSKASLFQKNRRDFRCDVAVKMPISSIKVTEFKALLDEVKIMAYIGSHENIIRFFGGCTDRIKKREVLLVMEYCVNGCLLSYLTTNRETFCSNATEAQDVGIQRYTNTADNDASFNTNTLLKWSIQTALGMEFLASIKIVHRDIAARNLLLSDKLRVKIADFGLSKKLEPGSDVYTSTSGEVPWKWLAPETFQIIPCYSEKSDVWAFGVALWEIFSLGETPYSGRKWNSTFPEDITQGLRLQKPLHATPDLYSFMKLCWNLEPGNRPTFSEAKQGLLAILNVSDDYSFVPWRPIQEYFEVNNS